VLLDEVQEVAGWERLVNSLLAEGRADVYLTGSNSRLLSSELATYIAGRYVAIEVSTLSFAEHLDFSEKLLGRDPAAIDSQFAVYLRQGGFPGLYQAGYTPGQIRQIVADIYSSAVLRDIIERHQVRNPGLFDRVARFALDNIGSPFSARRVSAFLKSQGKALSHQTVADYMGFLAEAFLLARVPRMDIRGRRLLATDEKHFAGDHGLVGAILGDDPTRLSGLLENIVWAELRRRGYQVAVGREGTAEVDFVADRAGDRMYIQVAASVLDESTRRREFAPLLSIPDSYPKYVLSLDPLASGNTSGVRHVRLPDFLLDQTW
jgi:predicted AAA+ superfamily ATPase